MNRFFLAALAALFLPAVSFAQAPPPPATTRVAKWKDDRKAVFLLMFDDSISSDIKTVFPELKARGFIGTFFINPARHEWQLFKDQWERELPAAGMVYGNHTMTHKGVEDAADAEQEIRACNDVILRLYPGKTPRLISYGQPGVAAGKWKLTPAELAPILAQNHLIERPTFDGHAAAISHKSAAEMLSLVDKALASGGVEHLVFHGVGADWIVTPVPEFLGLLDGLVARREALWITDPISAHQYETERVDAQVRVLETSERAIRLSLTTKADARFYDLPLTLITQVPPAWQRCTLTQGSRSSVIEPQNGTVRFEALPDGRPITLTPEAAR